MSGTFSWALRLVSRYNLLISVTPSSKLEESIGVRTLNGKLKGGEEQSRQAGSSRLSAVISCLHAGRVGLESHTCWDGSKSDQRRELKGKSSQISDN